MPNDAVRKADPWRRRFSLRIGPGHCPEEVAQEIHIMAMLNKVTPSYVVGLALTEYLLRHRENGHMQSARKSRAKRKVRKK